MNKILGIFVKLPLKFLAWNENEPPTPENKIYLFYIKILLKGSFECHQTNEY